MADLSRYDGETGMNAMISVLDYRQMAGQGGEAAVRRPRRDRDGPRRRPTSPRRSSSTLRRRSRSRSSPGWEGRGGCVSTFSPRSRAASGHPRLEIDGALLEDPAGRADREGEGEQAHRLRPRLPPERAARRGEGRPLPGHRVREEGIDAVHRPHDGRPLQEEHGCDRTERRTRRWACSTS